ncbi:MAG: NAD(P)-dependent oxidoreductase [Acidilobaceae archaeon]|nr:NAD(P)-dependent oxidoreductase [Acidilobaceae archaeon]
MAVLGAGLMGSAAAYRAKAVGFDVILWNRSIEKAEKVAKELNIAASGSLAEAVSKAEVALAFLADDDALLHVASGLPRADGLIFANFSTVTPRASAAAAKVLEGRGICYIETPVVGGPRVLREGKAIALVAGPQRCFRAARSAIDALSSEVIFVSEEVGKASALKLAYNNLLISYVASLAESLALAESYGLSPQDFKGLLVKTAFKELAERYFDRLLEEAPPGFKLSLAAKDLEYFCIAASEKHVAVPVACSAAQLYKLAARAGLAEKDYTSIYKFLKDVGVRR